MIVGPLGQVGMPCSFKYWVVSFQPMRALVHQMQVSHRVASPSVVIEETVTTHATFGLVTRTASNQAIHKKRK